MTLWRVAKRGRCRLLFLVGVKHVVHAELVATRGATLVHPVRLAAYVQHVKQLSRLGPRVVIMPPLLYLHGHGTALVCRYFLL